MTQTIALLLDEGFEDASYRVPLDRLRSAGYEVAIVGPAGAHVVAGRWGVERVMIDAAVEHRSPNDFDALLIAGGHAPDRLRVDEAVVDFVRRFCLSGKPVGAIGHGPQLLIEADMVLQHQVTSWPSVRTDLENAGATWIDEPVVEDPPLLTAQDPTDLEPFLDAFLAKLAGARAVPSQRDRVSASR